jgi:hypothetical protein
MSEEIVIDKQIFHNRLSEFITKWKNDKRANNVLFNDIGSIAICVGKASDGAYPKSAAFQVSPNFALWRVTANIWNSYGS